LDLALALTRELKGRFAVAVVQSGGVPHRRPKMSKLLFLASERASSCACAYLVVVEIFSLFHQHLFLFLFLFLYLHNLALLQSYIHFAAALLVRPSLCFPKQELS